MDDEIEIGPDDVDVAALPVVPIEGTLRKTVWVAGAGDPAGTPLKPIAKGTDARDIPPSELAQLCQEHFA